MVVWYFEVPDSKDLRLVHIHTFPTSYKLLNPLFICFYFDGKIEFARAKKLLKPKCRLAVKLVLGNIEYVLGKLWTIECKEIAKIQNRMKWQFFGTS